MNGKNLQNERLDRIGRELLETTRMRSEEIERIVAAPMLFDKVKARIEVEHRARESRGFFGLWRNLPSRNRQTIFAASAVSAILVFGLFGVFFFKKSAQQIEQVSAPAIPKSRESFETNQTPQIAVSAPEIEKKVKSLIKPRTIVRETDFKKVNLKARQFAPNTKLVKRPSRDETVPGGEFYALAFAGNTGGIGEELQIVRAELSRSSLFALGVNLPIENESEKIKTDLLVNADGLARAIRFVD